LLVHDLNLDEIQEVRDVWQFYRDRRPETYGEITRTQTARGTQAAD
jgi:beta-ureidopropionase